MKVATGTVVDGKVVVEGESLAEGSKVTVILREDEESFDLTPEEEAELLASIAEIERGDYITADDLLERLRRFHDQTFPGIQDQFQDLVEQGQGAEVEKGIAHPPYFAAGRANSTGAPIKPAYGVDWLAARSAASRVLTSSIARVIGPTPPGTGVIQPATSRTPS